MTEPRATVACYLHGPYFGDDCQGCIAVRYLGRLGKVDHPDAMKRPVHALGQVAVDLQQALNLVPKASCHGSCGALEARRQAFVAARCAVLQQFRLDEQLDPGDLEVGRRRRFLRIAIEQAMEKAAAAPPGPPDPPPPPPGRKVA